MGGGSFKRTDNERRGEGRGWQGRWWWKADQSNTASENNAFRNSGNSPHWADGMHLASTLGNERKNDATAADAATATAELKGNAVAANVLTGACAG